MYLTCSRLPYFCPPNRRTLGCGLYGDRNNPLVVARLEPTPVVIGKAVAFGTLAAVGIAVHTAINLRYLRAPAATGVKVPERVSVLIPARNEEAHIAKTVASILAQQGLDDLEVVVLDDGSTDDTIAIVQAIDDPRLKLIIGGDAPLPAGWLGKPWACARLGEFATGSVLVFVDADVFFEPEAIQGTVELLRGQGFSLVSPIQGSSPKPGLSALCNLWSYGLGVQPCPCAGPRIRPGHPCQPRMVNSSQLTPRPTGRSVAMKQSPVR